MSRTASALFSAAAMLAAPVTTAQTPPEAAMPAYTHQSVFPGQIAGIGFEMPKQSFVDLLVSSNLTYRSDSAATIFAVATSDTPFSEVVYFFNSEACQCLTEIEIRFADEAQATAYFNAKFPLQDSEGDYSAYDGVVTYRMKAWRFKSKVYVVAVLPNTRWSNQ
jgi:hypothetical protein